MTKGTNIAKHPAMKIITTTPDLNAACERMIQHPYLTVDTEFMRERTYWPVLCLIQAATPEEAVIIDPLAKGLDLAPFLELLAHNDIVKVFHAARQDLEIFYKLMGQLPAPLFDTQIAAMALGFGDQTGYDALVRAIMGVHLDKGSRFTDWSRRPLTPKQLDYALGDVTHLRDVYHEMKKRLDDKGRNAWIEDEMDILRDPAIYYIDPPQAWKRLKLRNIKPRELGPLMMLAEWRERTAQERDQPRGRIMKDDGLMELARAQPKTAEEMAKCRAVQNGFERSAYAKEVLKAITLGTEIPRNDLPVIDRKRDMSPIPADVLDLLRVLLKRQCETYQVAPKLLASSADLEKIARSDNAEVPAMYGWRREIFGEAALKLKQGKLALQLQDGVLNLVEC